MQRLAHARRLRARNELAEQDDALGVGRPLRRLLAERQVERIDERFRGRGHRGLLPCPSGAWRQSSADSDDASHRFGASRPDRSPGLRLDAYDASDSLTLLCLNGVLRLSAGATGPRSAREVARSYNVRLRS